MASAFNYEKLKEGVTISVDPSEPDDKGLTPIEVSNEAEWQALANKVEGQIYWWPA